jgi:hypothetical protein
MTMQMQIAIALVVGLLMFSGGCWTGGKLQADETAEARAELAAERLEAERKYAVAIQTARAQEQAWIKAAHDAEVKYEEERKKNAVAAAGADRALAGLRQQLAAARSGLSAASPAAGRKVGTAALDVVAECGERYREMAKVLGNCAAELTRVRQ